MTVMNTGLNVAGLRATFFERLRAEIVYFQQLSTRVESTKDIETYKWLGAVPNMREWGTGRLAKGLGTESYVVENMKYEATLEVDRDEISDDQTGQIKIRTQELAQRAATHKDFMIGELIKNGETAGFNAYDGKPFFATDHVSGSSGAQSNKLTFDISEKMPAEPNTPDDPSVATLRRAYSEAVAQMALYKDDQAEPLRIRPTGLVVACAPIQAQTFQDAINATRVADSSVSPLIGKPTSVIPMPELTDVSKFIILKTDAVVRPFIFQDREPIEFTALEEKSDEGFRREKYLYGVRARYRMTYGEWMYAVSVDLV